MINQITLRKFTDCASISIAGICAFHCLVTPALLILFPVMASTFFFEEVFHKFLLLMVIPSSAVAIFLGCRCHKDSMVIMLGTAGLSFLLIGAFAVREASFQELFFTIVGSFMMIFGHFRNFRLCRKDSCEY